MESAEQARALISNRIRVLLAGHKAGNPTAQDLVKLGDIAHRTAQKLLQEAGELPNPETFKRVVGRLWPDDHEARREMHGLYFHALFGEPVPEVSAEPGAASQHSADAIVKMFGLPGVDGLARTEAAEARAVIEGLARDGGRVTGSPPKLTDGVMRFLRHGRCIFTADYPEAPNGMSQSLFWNVGGAGPIVVQMSVALVPRALLSEWHRHDFDIQVSLCLAGRLVVRTARTEDRLGEKVSTVEVGEAVVVFPRTYHEVASESLGATHVTIRVENTCSILADPILQLKRKEGVVRLPAWETDESHGGS